ncbi:MAG: PIN domain-containing protein [Thermoleophilaceae bacterium]|nr:PIN domain-containing protein [Thermoleophilaceae bacterium]
MTDVGRFGSAVVLADTSAWGRASLPPVAADWSEAIRRGEIVTSPVVELEVLFAARDAPDIELREEVFAPLRRLALSASVAHAALAAMRELAGRSAGYHRIPLPDYLIAASAQEFGIDVLHYDHHYDRLAEVMRFESRWIAPPGSL